VQRDPRRSSAAQTIGAIEQSTRRGDFKRPLAGVDESRSDSTRNAALAARTSRGNSEIAAYASRVVENTSALSCDPSARSPSRLGGVNHQVPAGPLVFTMQAISTVIGTREANATNTGSRAESVVFSDAPLHVIARPRWNTLKKRIAWTCDSVPGSHLRSRLCPNPGNPIRYVFESGRDARR
jgi:hypothetical protein